MCGQYAVLPDAPSQIGNAHFANRGDSSVHGLSVYIRTAFPLIIIINHFLFFPTTQHEKRMLTCALASTLSSIFSTVSLGSWICAQMPQIYTNYVTKSAEGISPLFLLLWFMGDFLSFTSCLINQAALSFQVYLSLFFICNDVALCYQYYYYNSVYPRIRYGQVAQENTQEIESDEPAECIAPTTSSEAISFHPHVPEVDPERQLLSESSGSENSYSSISHHKRPGIVTIATVGSVLNAGVSNAAAVGRSGDDKGHTGSLLMLMGLSTDMLALCLAWGCTIVYVSSRCPQLYKNYVRKSVEGMSPMLFGAALLGNLTYTISILVSCQFIFAEDKLQFLWHQLPYILGSLGTVVFDFAYFYQRHIYRGRRSAHTVMSLEAWNV